MNKFFKIYKGHLKTLDARTDLKQVPYWGPQVIGVALKQLVATANWRPEFLQLCLKNWL